MSRFSVAVFKLTHIRTTIRKWILPHRVTRLSGVSSIRTTPDELNVVCLVRNGEQWIESFLDHYFELGAVHVCLMDNGSTDATVRIAQNHRNYNRVTILQSDLPYARYKYLLKWYLAKQFSGEGWVLLADIDELFTYPMSTQLDLRGLLQYLNYYGYTSVVIQLLDMFAEQPLRRSAPATTELLKEKYVYYDLDNLSYSTFFKGTNSISNYKIRKLSGGIRKRLFDVRPSLTKHSLFRPGNTNVAPALNSSHSVTGARIADISCAFLHYKLVDGFYDFTNRAVATNSYFNNSMEYKAYQRVLKNTHELRMTGPTTKLLKDTDKLVEEEFLVVSYAYQRWVSGYNCSP